MLAHSPAIAFVPLKGIGLMSFSGNHIFRTVYRALFVIVIGMATGFLFYGSLIFVPTKPPFQFTLSSISAGLFYGISKSSSYRNALAVALIWNVVSTLIAVHNWWMFIVFLIYIAGISAAVYVYMIVVKRPLFNGILQRVVTASLLTGTFNALVILLLSVLQFTFSHFRLSAVPNAAVDNFQLGTLIGLGVGVGIEIAEYTLRLKSFRRFIEAAKAQ
ncbi:MAG: hypothetical protein NTZ35_14970 [Ignavibacteriales bacterium]|nr:hypothetical protein [Ignavibacteriales bacterium]